MPYSIWRGMIGHPMDKRAAGTDGRPYVVRVDAVWDEAGGARIRVSVTVTPARGLRRRSVSHGFVITPDGELFAPA
jgi:hypothetical protein